jgi:DinB superfamily
VSATAERDAVLGGFDRARVDFEESLRRAPDAALRYKPTGEDYALGGLVVHVTDVLRRYTQVIDAIRQAQFGALVAAEHVTPAEDAERIGAGFDGAARGPVVEEMRAAHAAFVDAVVLSPADDFARQAAVTYGGASALYPTSFADVVGWVADHYREHTQQIADLVSAWAQATR